MIQVVDLLKKDYSEVKDKVTWDKDCIEEVESLLKVGLIPQHATAKINEEVYLYDLHVKKFDVKFLNNKIFELVFGAMIESGVKILFNLINTGDFRLEFFTKKVVDDYFEKYRIEHGEEPEAHEIDLHFDESWKFDFTEIMTYELIRLFSKTLKIEIFMINTTNGSILMQFFVNDINENLDFFQAESLGWRN